MPKRHKTKTDTGETVFQFKITLCDSSPKIWRRILVPKTYSFFDLYTAIQDAMGWNDSHLHSFYITEKGKSAPIFIQMPDPEGGDGYGRHETRDERHEKVADYFGVLVKQCQYTYDFGDGWDHTVLFERETPADSDVEYPQCIAGENACPPEDCGGVGGYEELQKVLKNPQRKEHRSMLEWLGLENMSEFDSTRFELDKVHFRDPSQWLKEYVEGFEIATGSKDTSEHTREQSENLAKAVASLKDRNLSYMGRWEIAQKPEPIATEIGSMLILTMVVHEESYFIMSTRVSSPDETGSGLVALIEAIEKHGVLPELLQVQDEKLFNELKSVADELHFKIAHTRKLKAIPQVFRDMVRMMKRHIS